MKSVYQPRSVIDVSDAMKVMFVKQLVSVFLAELENCADNTLERTGNVEEQYLFRSLLTGNM